MIICRHFCSPVEVVQGCRAGRIAYVDCGSGCATYDPDPEPMARPTEDLQDWAGAAPLVGNGDNDVA
jgi:hypothetical protein